MSLKAADTDNQTRIHQGGYYLNKMV